MKTTLSLAALLLIGIVPTSSGPTQAAPEMAPAPAYTGYLACYFDKSEGGERQEPESLHYALSRDGFHFSPVNAGKAVLVSTVGDKRMRDPMILRDGAGVFHLVVTNSWDKLQFTLWDSSDLIHWTGERLVVPPDPDLKPTWAPELGYDPASKKYFVFWTTGKTGWDSTHIYAMTTADFKSWSPPQTLYQHLEDGKNVPVMDASLFQAGGKHHLLYRYNKQIWQVTSSGSALGPFDTNDHMVMDIDGEGPFAYQLNGKDEWNMVYDYFGGNQGKWGVATSTDGMQWKLATDPKWPYYQNNAASFPEGVRHGAILAITEGEYEKLAKEYKLDTPKN